MEQTIPPCVQDARRKRYHDTWSTHNPPVESNAVPSDSTPQVKTATIIASLAERSQGPQDFTAWSRCPTLACNLLARSSARTPMTALYLIIAPAQWSRQSPPCSRTEVFKTLCHRGIFPAEYAPSKFRQRCMCISKPYLALWHFAWRYHEEHRGHHR